jgi:hypothetical protein
MDRFGTTGWEIGAGLAIAALAGAAATWYLKRKRPTEDELERTRRRMLVQMGRLVDGMLLDVQELEAAEERVLTMLLFSYRIGGVDYECSQDISALRGLLDISQIRAGFPCSVRYQPGKPQNSIVLAEDWNGMRMGLPAFHPFEKKDVAAKSRARGAAEQRQAQA